MKKLDNEKELTHDLNVLNHAVGNIRNYVSVKKYTEALGWINTLSFNCKLARKHFTALIKKERKNVQ